MPPLQLLQKRYSTSETLSLAIPFRTVDNRDTRMQRPRARPPFIKTLQSLQPVPPGDPLDDSPLLTELPRALPRCIVSRHATAWAESLEGAISGHQSLAVLCRYRCHLLLAEVPQGTDRNAELKLRLRLREAGEVSELISRILGQQHSGPVQFAGENE